MFDFSWFRAVNNMAGKWPILDVFGIFSAVYLIAAILVLAALVSFLRKDIYIYLRAISAAFLGYSISQWISIINFRPRPFTFLENVNLLISKSPESKSFPSDHATLAFAIAVSLILSGERKWGTVALVAAVFVALGRVYVGVHFPLDILAGALLGTGSAYAAHYAWRFLRKGKK